MSVVPEQKESCAVPEWQAYQGWRIIVNPKWESPALREMLVAEKEPSDVVLIQQGRERVVKAPWSLGDEACEIVIKTYRAPGRLREIFEKKEKGSKAFRAYCAAQILCRENVGTPEPIAVAERRGKNGALLESRLVTQFVSALTDFRLELLRIYAEEPDCEKLMTLMQNVADACRAMHDCGVVHRDLGNQNIGLKRNADNTWNIVFFDLDRVRIFPAGAVADAQRGRDLARLDLPSDFRRVFHVMYYCGYGAPGSFYEAEARERKAFARHSALRPFRHPFREWKIRREWIRAAKKAGVGSAIPLGKELWIWDERSVQAIPAYASKERRKFRSSRNIFLIAKEFFLRGNAIWKSYKRVASESFSTPVDFSETLGMSLEADPLSWESQLHWLGELEGENAKLPILLRVYHHKGRSHWNYVCEKSRELSARGNSIALAFVQDREAIREPESWREMIFLVIEKTRNFSDFYEVGHATNRGKWGVWDFRDYTKKLLPALIDAKAKYSQIKLTGPACIDFDLHTLPGLLSEVPAGTFTSLSQHLYVDRRGAPENFQGRFDLVGKCAIHRALARVYGFSEEKIIISEVNWPLLGAGVYGPTDSPIVTHGPWETRPASPWTIEPPRVSEDDYAKFMCRYLLLAVASGHASRVYWWQLMHRGFGLIDNSDPQNPRPRVAFFALRDLLEKLSNARFECRISEAPAGTTILEFSRTDGSRFRASWTLDSFPAFEDVKTARENS